MDEEISFYTNLRGSQSDTKEEEREKQDVNDTYDYRYDKIYEIYKNGEKQNGKKNSDIMSRDEFTDRMNSFIGQVGAKEGKWSLDDYNAGRVSEEDWNNFSNSLFSTIYKGLELEKGYNYTSKIKGDDNYYETVNSDRTAWDMIKDTEDMTDDEKAAYNRLKRNWVGDRNSDFNKRTAENWGNDTNWGDRIGSLFGITGDYIGGNVKNWWNTPYFSDEDEESFRSDYNKMVDYVNRRDAQFSDILDNYETYIADYKPSEKTKTEETPTTTENQNTNNSNTNSGDGYYQDENGVWHTPDGDISAEDPRQYTGEEVSFKLNPGDSYGGFAQKIVDLGLATDAGLWGDNGDVAFYTQQLFEQGALDDGGNLKIGTPITLKKRRYTAQ